jgi:uridylate kinase
MSGNFVYNRVLLKLSGETLKGNLDHGYDAEAVRNAVGRIKPLVDQGLEVAIVVGAGNIWRGVMGANTGMDPVTCDYMGMLATMMNALCLKEFCNNSGMTAVVYGSTAFGTAIPQFDRDRALRDLEAGKVVIFAGGTGSPFFTTDTTAALRACEIGAEALLKATKVDGIYDKDPVKYPDAVRFEKLSYLEVLAKELHVMDTTATSLCMDNNLPILVFDLNTPDNIRRVATGEPVGTLISAQTGGAPA